MHFHIFIISMLIFSGNCFADNLGLFPKTQLAVQQNLYTGDKNASLSESSPGYGLEGLVMEEGRHFSPFFAASIATITGKQSFLDSLTAVKASFVYYGAEADAGLLFFPISRRIKGINIYFSAAGLVGYNFIAIDKDTVLSTIPYNDQAFSAGYSAGIGAEWILSNSSTRKWTLAGKIEYKNSSATLLKRTFGFNRGCFSLGLAW